MKKTSIFLLFLGIISFAKAQDDIYLNKEYPFINNQYIVSNKIKEIKIYNSDGALLAVESYNNFGGVTENIHFENSLISERITFNYNSNKQLEEVNAINFRGGHIRNYKSIYTYNELNQHQFTIQYYGKDYIYKDTISKFFYNDLGQKASEIYSRSMQRKFIYENNLLIKTTYSPILGDDKYLKVTNLTYQNNKLAKEEIIESSDNSKINETINEYLYQDDKLIGYNDYTYLYENNIVTRIKFSSRPDKDGFNIVYLFYK